MSYPYTQVLDQNEDTHWDKHSSLFLPTKKSFITVMTIAETKNIFC
jgi:hypothetical protein